MSELTKAEAAVDIPEDILAMVLKQFEGDKKRTNLWFVISNPELNNQSPLDLLRNNQEVRLRRAVSRAVKMLDPQDLDEPEVDVVPDELLKVREEFLAAGGDPDERAVGSHPVEWYWQQIARLWRGKAQRQSEQIKSFYQAIEHGDEEHRQWLYDEVEKHFEIKLEQ